METQAKHTPTPWIVDECTDSRGFLTVREADGSKCGNTNEQLIATIYDTCNAEFIVRACNNHDKMRELLDRAANHLQDMEAETGSDMNNGLAMEIWEFLQNT